MPENPSDSTGSFVSQLTAEQRRIYAYIRSLVWNVSDAEDVLQAANEVLWTKRADFEPGTDFGSWAIRIAHFEVLAYRKRKRLDRHVFDDELLSQMAENVEQSTSDVGAMQVYLDECVEQLPESHRVALRMRYEPGVKIADIAKSQDRSVSGVSQLLYRIRTRVRDWVNEKLSSEGRDE